MSDPIFCVQRVDGAPARRSRTFVGPDQEEYVWKSKNNRLEVRTRPLETDPSLSASAVARQERTQNRCRVWFARAFTDRSRARPRVSGTRRVHLPRHPKTAEVFVQNGLEFRVSLDLEFFVKSRFPRSSCIGTFQNGFLRLIIIVGWKEGRLRGRRRQA